MLAVSTSPLIARYLNHLDPISISFWRMLIGAVILHVYSFFMHSSNYSFNKNTFKTIISGILLGIHFALFYGAISLLPNNITNATVFGTLAPLFALFIEIYYGRKISNKLVIGLCVVSLGSCMMFIYDFSLDGDLTKGNILAVLCSICFAFVFILSDQVRKTETALNFSKFIFTYAAITLAIIGLFMKVDFLNLNKSDFLFLLFLGIVPTIIGHSVFYYLVKYLSPTIVASVPLGEPFIASVIAWAIFPGQILNAYIIFGGLITLIGLFIIINSKKT
tara:strand:- start:664 stop:1494 length:831 start_codon:yes stop_codon:yes gene_type:complete